MGEIARVNRESGPSLGYASLSKPKEIFVKELLTSSGSFVKKRSIETKEFHDSIRTRTKYGN
jgi:hypothetical protein